MLSAALAEGLTPSWVDAADLPDDVFTCKTFGSGSISEETPDSLEKIELLGQKLGLKNSIYLDNVRLGWSALLTL